MKTIYKYPLQIKDEQVIAMPPYPLMLSVQFQGEQLVVWAIVDNEASYSTDVEFVIYGTGHKVDDEITNQLHYIGTVQKGDMVWHVFQNLRRKQA